MPDTAPYFSTLPKHIAIIMDGNGRWALERSQPRITGHRQGVEALKNAVQVCLDLNINALTLFAFSTENWVRPKGEVRFLMNLFAMLLQKETKKLSEHNIRLSIIGNRFLLDKKLQSLINDAEQQTADKNGLFLNVAINYGGQWDITQATKKVTELVLLKKITVDEITPAVIGSHLSLANLPDPDLFIRTSGEYRLSNFLIWQLAYSELYFTDEYWPDFTKETFYKALEAFSQRERRFGQVKETMTCA